jgi:hypothetical protein
MAIVLADRVKVRSQTAGTGTITLADTALGFQSFEVVGSGNETYYGIIDNAGNWEIGQGTYTKVLTVETLSRDTVISSSNNNAKINFPVGGKNVFGTLPSSLVQTTTNTVVCEANVSTIVYTGPRSNLHTIKLLVQAEGNVTAGLSDTQSCEIIVAKSVRGDNVAATVYGIVHTSVAPLATFTAQWNAGTARVEVLCTPASTTYAVAVKTFATEIQTSI